MQNLFFKKANLGDIDIIHDLAAKIWHACYASIITVDQIDYMLNKMYSKESLIDQMKNDHVFYLAYENQNAVGYLSYCDKLNGDYFLNKLYVSMNVQSNGIGKELMNYVFGLQNDLKTIRLTVNRKNFKAINFYFRNGFIIEEVKDFDIGDGYFMKDFIMLKK